MATSREDIAIDFFSQTWGNKLSRNLTSSFEVFSENLIVNSPIRYQVGAENLKAVMNSWFTSFPDVIAKVEQVHKYRDSVVINWTSKGSHQAPFQSIEPTGKTFFTKGELAFIFNKEGQVVHYMASVNVGDILAQLGQDISNTLKPSSTLDERIKLLIYELKLHYLSLSNRELESTALFIVGFSAKQIGIMLSISYRTVETHLEQARAKCDCVSRAQMNEKFLSDHTFFLFHDLARFLLMQHSVKLQGGVS